MCNTVLLCDILRPLALLQHLVDMAAGDTWTVLENTACAIQPDTQQLGVKDLITSMLDGTYQ